MLGSAEHTCKYFGGTNGLRDGDGGNCEVRRTININWCLTIILDLSIYLVEVKTKINIANTNSDYDKNTFVLP